MKLKEKLKNRSLALIAGYLFAILLGIVSVSGNYAARDANSAPSAAFAGVQALSQLPQEEVIPPYLEKKVVHVPKGKWSDPILRTQLKHFDIVPDQQVRPNDNGALVDIRSKDTVIASDYEILQFRSMAQDFAITLWVPKGTAASP